MTTFQRVRSLRCAVSVGFVAVLVSACSGQVEHAEDTVDSGELAAQISARLEEQFDQRPEGLHCPSDLPALDGASVTCELTDASQVYDVTVTTTSVEGDTVNFDFAVAEEPRDSSVDDAPQDLQAE